MPTRISTSTTQYSQAYLAIAWRDRKRLADYERRGFGQFLYLTATAHLEEVLKSLIRSRCRSIEQMVDETRPAPKQFHQNGHVQLCDWKPVCKSLILLVGETRERACRKGLVGLTESYDRIFLPKLKAVLGSELYEDLHALGALRNLIAHGEDLAFEFQDPLTESSSTTLDAHPLQKPVARLRKAKILSSRIITHANNDQLRADIYCDDALLYFYNKVRLIEDELAKNISFAPESALNNIHKLPPFTL